ncbi:MAG: hypothetical protein NC829_00490 [Candidatus Omnitrophica bacterium]|nr:hypothetical protein [Candidatus Omnitrophota bacterium]
MEYENLSQTINYAHNHTQTAKRNILELVSRQAKLKNESIDINTRIQTSEARKKRLDIDKAKIEEERIGVEEALAAVQQESDALEKQFDTLNLNISAARKELDNASQEFSEINKRIRELENLKLSLNSQKELIEKLMLKYQDASSTMNAIVLVDRLPEEEVSGLIVKVKKGEAIKETEGPISKDVRYRFEGEAKTISLNIEEVNNRIKETVQKIEQEYNLRQEKEGLIATLNSQIKEGEEAWQKVRLELSHKNTEKDAIIKQRDKICDEKNIIDLELAEIQDNLNLMHARQNELQQQQIELTEEITAQEQIISTQQELINTHTQKREELLVSLTQMKTELEALRKRKDQDVSTLNILQHTYDQDKDDLIREEEEREEIRRKLIQINLEIENLGRENDENINKKYKQEDILKNLELRLREMQDLYKNDHLNLEGIKKEAEDIKNALHELKMQEQETSFKYAAIKDRIQEVYKIDLEAITDSATSQDVLTLQDEISRLKEKLDSYGNVNLVAIDEYDELKKRYDFLTQQQNDLLTAKQSLQEAITKINRTTKQMFQETFQKICEEFKNYFRLLFGGGDAKLFLVDEQDPLESGIEIIARPPGKKLQNVLLLSGGEKALAAVALLFAIFKVKPVSFCILDEVDAALDEANVDRFGHMLCDFAQTSQFILITHNKKTIAHANVMYGITMEKSGISKIVSVKFSHAQTAKKNPAPQPEVSEPA